MHCWKIGMSWNWNGGMASLRLQQMVCVTEMSKSGVTERSEDAGIC